MNKEIRAAGYIRVSSIGQTENESLPSQRKAIEEICHKRNYKLTKIYADEGISGSTVEEREDLLNALQDAQHRRYDVLIVWDITRFGRNLRDTLENYETLKEAGVKFYSLKEGGDFDNPSGKLKLSTMGMIAEYESEKIKERMVGGRIAKAKRGIPPTNKLPFGRTFDEKKEKGKRWAVDQNKADAMEWVYQEYVKKDRSLRQIAEEIKGWFGFQITYHYLTTVLKEKCGTHWEMYFEEYGEPISFEIPPLLESHQIQAIKERLAHNRTNNRTDTRNYLLTGFIRCEDCMHSLSGQSPHDGRYQYYVHPTSMTITCDAFTTIPLLKVENAVFQTIFENIYDVPAFEKAIKDSLPDTDFIQDLKHKISKGQKQIDKIKKKRKRLVDAVLNGTLEQDSIKESDKELKKRQEQIECEIEDLQNRLANLPDPEEIKEEAHQIRMMLKLKYRSEDHLQNMSFEEKKKLLHFLFDGKAPNGDHYGIYINKRGSGKNAEIDYFMFGRLTGLRTIKGDDIDYFPGDEDESRKDRKRSNSDSPELSDFPFYEGEFIEVNEFYGQKRLKKRALPNKNDYKTNNLALIQKNQKI